MAEDVRAGRERARARWPWALIGVAAVFVGLLGGVPVLKAHAWEQEEKARRAMRVEAGPPARTKTPAGANPAARLGEILDLPVSSNANVFTGSTIRPTVEYPSVAYRLTVCLANTASVVNVQIDPVALANGAGGTTREFDLNSGTALDAGEVYTFVWGATRSCIYNIQCETSTTVAYLLLEEIKDGGN